MPKPTYDELIRVIVTCESALTLEDNRGIKEAAIAQIKTILKRAGIRY